MRCEDDAREELARMVEAFGATVVDEVPAQRLIAGEDNAQSLPRKGVRAWARRLSASLAFSTGRER